MTKNPDTLNIYSQTVSEDSEGNPVAGTPSYVEVMGSMQPSKPTLKISVNGQSINVKYVLYITDQTYIDLLETLSTYDYLIYNTEQLTILDVKFYQKHVEIYV